MTDSLVAMYVSAFQSFWRGSPWHCMTGIEIVLVTEGATTSRMH